MGEESEGRRKAQGKAEDETSQVTSLGLLWPKNVVIRKKRGRIIRIGLALGIKKEAGKGIPILRSPANLSSVFTILSVALLFSLAFHSFWFTSTINQAPSSFGLVECRRAHSFRRHHSHKPAHYHQHHHNQQSQQQQQQQQQRAHKQRTEEQMIRAPPSGNHRQLSQRNSSATTTTTTYQSNSSRQVLGGKDEFKGASSRLRLKRRQAASAQDSLELAVSRLQILESLDEQLKEFAGSMSTINKKKQTKSTNSNKHLWPATCALELHFNDLKQEQEEEEEEEKKELSARNKLDSCLSSERLRRQLPPYMLNLYQQLQFESRSLSEAVRSMPYHSLVMRSFRQPVISRKKRLILLDQHKNKRREEEGEEAVKQQQQNQQEPEKETTFFNPSETQSSKLNSTNWLPKLERAAHEDGQRESGGAQVASLDDQVEVGEGVKEEEEEVEEEAEEEEPNVVVELSALGPDPLDFGRAFEGQASNYKLMIGQNEQEEEGEEASRENNKELGNQHGYKATADSGRGRGGACHQSERILPAHERSELCFWFRISEQLRKKINGSLERARGESSSWKRELLVEAELHVFKLLPDMLSNELSVHSPTLPPTTTTAHTPTANSNWTESRRTAVKQQQQPPHWRRLQKRRTINSNTNNNRRNSAQVSAGFNHSNGNFYHLKTNLLEVSLYQILAPKEERNRARFGDKDRARGQPSSIDAQYPLRLLDIRRIDLHSSGWETFYVKRAVEDWIRDASSNLGLVIKAKSMFEEPIRIGLIRFADAYDHEQDLNRAMSGQMYENPQPAAPFSEQNESKRTLFSHSSHQFSGPTNRTNHLKVGGGGEVDKEKDRKRRKRKLKDGLEFDVSHQPVLVIYTTSASE